MDLKEKIIVAILGLVTLFVCVGTTFYTPEEKQAQNVYQVYLNGKKLGLIQDKNELLNLIDEEQADIKNTYHVQNVYPPNGFEIEEYVTYDEEIITADEIYQKIQEASDFTVEGYLITITKKASGEEKKDKKTTIQVLDEQVFKDALESLVTTFVNEKDYQNYIHNTQAEIKDVGSIIRHMYFEEAVSIKKAYISVKNKIYTDKAELSQYLLYGTTKQKSGYIVQKGDTLATIAEASKLNVQELLIANPKLRGENTVLKIGDTINNSIIDPIMTLVQEVRVVEDVDIAYEKKRKVDQNMNPGTSKITQAGVTGRARITQEMRLVNGERTQDTTVISHITLREKVDEITSVGPSYGGTGTYIDTGLDWGWPTNQPYIITTNYEYRWGSFHNALDISGTGFGSPIYAARGGTVVEVYSGCSNYGSVGNMCGGSYGNHIIIDHGNNYYTLYGHLTSNLRVGTGTRVSKGQVIGFMGSSGSSNGPHLHFGTYRGYPNKGGKSFNPWSLYR